ncbi:uncharacterized protein L969DRAFT_93701 [Mixia osmundae IAM 14324]|uniref:HCNGP-like protein n=1 Tax=Mixia osmundae (strain CBS 9802 / IAM 14324 / JCM 22182 / KY 12970) TaxID=764103 RepID=G7E9C0_MIXOS|nr:uncharacterized protein L969DRAFT_93701 [Mixia osmundae IAM 14324]KEI39866.1 hypothetical protein L969DRAFT_93701 [Mixia osmundae IAM 14324]GAA99239.1 hypothetical protein E5Q_05933 [Mixia osmundae IAM 14324]
MAMPGLVGYGSSDGEPDDVQVPSPKQASIAAVQTITSDTARSTPERVNTPTRLLAGVRIPSNQVGSGSSLQISSVPQATRSSAKKQSNGSRPPSTSPPVQRVGSPDGTRGSPRVIQDTPKLAAGLLSDERRLALLQRMGVDPSSSAEPVSETLEAKLATFHELKSTGIHFNDTLVRNKAFRNPHILSKLVDFLNIDEKTSNFPKSVWDAQHGLPPEASASRIAEAQKRRAEERTAAQAPGKRSAIAFESSSSRRPEEYSRQNDKRRRSRSPPRRR